MLILLGHVGLKDRRERGNTFRTVEMRIGAGTSGGALRMEKTERRLPKVRWEQSRCGPRSTPAVRGSVVPGIWGWTDRLREHCIPGIFSASGRHARDLPTPEIQRYGPLLSWIISRDIFLLPGGGVGNIVSCDILSPPAHHPSPLPVTLPGVPDIIVIDLMLIGLFVQEIKHVFDGEGQRTPTMCCTEDGLKQVIHEFLQGALKRRKRERWLSNIQCQQKDEPLTKGRPLNQFHFYSYHLEEKHSTACVTQLVLSGLYRETDTVVISPSL